MGRLCERPGCSDPASVAYGMRPEDLVFWLDVVDDSSVDSGGVLCQRHADSMVVPRGWTLDDLRDPDLHLFRPPAREDRPRRRNHREHHGDGAGEQLELGVDDGIASSADARRRAGVPDGPTHDDLDVSPVGVPIESGQAIDGSVDAELDAWAPSFDSEDDLDGLLAARTPLLARAFRGDDRPRG